MSFLLGMSLACFEIYWGGPDRVYWIHPCVFQQRCLLVCLLALCIYRKWEYIYRVSEQFYNKTRTDRAETQWQMYGRTIRFSNIHPKHSHYMYFLKWGSCESRALVWWGKKVFTPPWEIFCFVCFLVVFLMFLWDGNTFRISCDVTNILSHMTDQFHDCNTQVWCNLLHINTWNKQPMSHFMFVAFFFSLVEVRPAFF